MKHKGKLFIVSSPSGGGKSSIIGRILKKDANLSLSTSHTSRTPRPGEIDGKHYHFVTRKEFRGMKKSGDFVESVRLHKEYYGTSRHEIEILMAAGRDILLDIDVQGGGRVKEIFPDAVSIFILPPSLEVLEERLRKRGSDSEEQIRTRLDEAVREMKAAARYRYCIVNDRLNEAVKQFDAVVTAERLNLPKREIKKLIKGISTPREN